jgi:hypothetical protein
MFCRDRAELYLPEMYNKIGVGLVSGKSSFWLCGIPIKFNGFLFILFFQMAWGPLGMYLTENSERLFFSKTSLRSKTQNSSWTEDEVAKEVSDLWDGWLRVAKPQF